jgi:butyryl-CoA dehydrogenase
LLPSDEEGQFPTELFKKVSELGYFGIRYPEEYGGVGGDGVMFTLLCKELARGSLSLAASVSMQCLMGTNFIYRFGTEEQKQRLLLPAIRGEKISVIAMTEPDAGSDLGSIKTIAVRDGDGYVLNGQKTWVTNAPRADFFTVAAKTDPEAGFKGIDMFLVEDASTRIFASYGFAMEYDVQRYFRDARLLLLGGGTSEILRTVISRQMGL